MSWQKLDQILPQETKALHLRAEVGSDQVCMLWHKYAAKWLSNYALGNHEAINFRDGVITIIAINPLLVGNIQPYQRKIIQAINRALDSTVVKSIKYRF